MVLPHHEPGVALLEKQLGVQCVCYAKAQCPIHDPDLLLEKIQQYQATQSEQLKLPLNCAACGENIKGA